MSITNRALLVQLSISQWAGRKYDKRVSDEVVSAHNAAKSAGRFNKSLLPANEALADVHHKSAQIRQKFYKNTLPWGIDGTMVLPTENYLPFINEFRQDKADWEALVHKFLGNYEAARLDAQRTLGSLYVEGDYPTVVELERKFNIDLAVFPVPASDFRVAIGDAELDRIQKDVERRVKEAEQIAMRDLWERLYKTVTHIKDKLADPEGIFRNSMIENAKELCDMLPRLNFTDDPHLNALQQEIKNTLLSHQPDTLRNDMVVRRTTADEARAIADKMRVFMEGLK